MKKKNLLENSSLEQEFWRPICTLGSWLVLLWTWQLSWIIVPKLLRDIKLIVLWIIKESLVGCYYHRLFEHSSSSFIGTTAHCGLWPVEQCPSIFSYLPPTLSIISLPALEDLFLLPLSILSWVFPFFSSLPSLWTLHKDNLKRNHGVSDLFQVRVWSRVWASYVTYCEGDATRRQAVGWVGALKVFHRFVLSTVTSEFCISTCK